MEKKDVDLVLLVAGFEMKIAVKETAGCCVFVVGGIHI